MTGYELTTIVGNVGKADDLKYLQSGVAVLNFTVAVNIVSGSGDQRTEKTKWYRVAAWRQLAESLAPYIEKGKQVMIVGTVDARAYADNAGQPAASLEMTAQTIKLLGSKGERDDAKAPAADVGDIPF